MSPEEDGHRRRERNGMVVQLPRQHKQSSSRDSHTSRARTTSMNTKAMLAIVGVCMYWHLFIWRTQHIMESYLKGKTFMDFLISQQAPPPREPRYIIFDPIKFGQGTGNIINGLLAAHLLGVEFDRIICVSPEYKSFHLAFRRKQPHEFCLNATRPRHAPKENVVRDMITYGKPPDECVLKQQLASDIPVLYMEANTYPRWPAVPDKFFTTYYEPTEALRAVLPWKEAPEVVVHLRAPDGEHDIRSGLDNVTLDELGRVLPSSTFLVTNRIAWYGMFAEKWGWSNPGWHGVVHTAQGLHKYMWGHDGNTTADASLRKKCNLSKDDLKLLQMWSDWYTMILAKKIWHTHSDFSLSAIHWMNIPSKTIVGTKNDSTLLLSDEPWIRDGESASLADRTDLRRYDRLRREFEDCTKEAA